MKGSLTKKCIFIRQTINQMKATNLLIAAMMILALSCHSLAPVSKTTIENSSIPVPPGYKEIFRSTFLQQHLLQGHLEETSGGTG